MNDVTLKVDPEFHESIIDLLLSWGDLDVFCRNAKVPTAKLSIEVSKSTLDDIDANANPDLYDFIQKHIGRIIAIYGQYDVSQGFIKTSEIVHVEVRTSMFGIERIEKEV